MLAPVAVTAQCGGQGTSAPGITHSGSTAGVPSTSAATTTSSTTAGDNQLFESDTFSFEYPSNWGTFNQQMEPSALETALVGPGNTTDGATMAVFKARNFETKQAIQRHIAQLRAEVQAESGRIVEGPAAWTNDKDFTGFFVSYRAPLPDGRPGARQVGQFYFRGRLYRLTCQYLRSHAVETGDGCRLILRTLEIDGLDDLREP
jgi:hypothetical protein